MGFFDLKKSHAQLQLEFNLAADTVYGHNKDAKEVVSRLSQLNAELKMLNIIKQSDIPIELETNEPFIKTYLENKTINEIESVIVITRQEY
jgi:hypothetical protein